jgi:hypothetical protein
MPSTSNFDLTYNQQNVVAGGALSNPSATTGTTTGGGVNQIIAGSNITISPTSGTGNVTISATGGGTGTVTNVATGTGLVGGPITTTGTISLASAYAGNGIGTVSGIAKGNGAGIITAATAGTDYVIPSGSITGTASNITASTNSTLTSLPSLTLPGSQVSGNISGNASNVTGTVAITNGGTGATTASAARTNLGLGTVATQAAPSGTSSQLLANNGSGGFNNVSVGSGLTYSGGTLTATSGGGGTVTSVGTSGSVNGITLTGGPITTSGTVTLGGTLSGIANSQLTNNSVTVSAGTGLSGGGTVALGGTTTLTNAGVTSLTASGSITLSGSTGGVTIGTTGSTLPSGGSFRQRLYTASGGSAAWQYDPWVYAEDYGYGASGNTVTQNTTALQNAVNATVSLNGCLLLPPGVIHINSAITVGSSGSPFNGVIRIQGSGKLVTEIVQDSGTNGFTVYLANPNLENIGIEFEDLSVIGNNSSCGTAIYINIIQYGSIENRDLVCINNVSVTGVITNNSGGWTNGFWIIGGWHLLITNCYAAGYLSGGNPPSSGLGSGAGFLIQDCVNVKLDTITAEWWGRGISLIQPNYTTQGVQINNVQTLQTTNAIYNNGSTMYVTNFLFDNGNIFNSSSLTVNVVNHFGGGYMVGGQILQKGGANQVSIYGNSPSGPSGLMISDVDFTQQDSLTGASILITNSSQNNLITSCYFASAVGIQCDNGCTGNRAYGNIIPNGCTDNNTSSPFNYLGDDIGYTNVFTLTGGSTTETHYLSVSPSQLGRKPDGVSAQVTSDATVGCYYNWDDLSNSKTQVAIVFFKYSGGNLSSGPVRITARCGP